MKRSYSQIDLDERRKIERWRQGSDVVRARRQLGHWECDLIQFRPKFGKANVTSLVR